MKTKHTRTALTLVSALTALAGASGLAQANENTTDWQLKTGLMLVDSNNPYAVDSPFGGQVQAGGNAELGASIALEYRWIDRVGLEIGVAYAKSPDIEDNSDENGNVIGEGPGYFSTLVGANFYLDSSERFDLFVGPRVGFVSFGDFNLDIAGEPTAFEVNDDFAWGAAVGATYPLGDSRWSLLGQATYLKVDMTVSERGFGTQTENRFDPLMINLGVTRRF